MNHLRILQDGATESNIDLQNLLDMRQRYMRLLSALPDGHSTDEHLRSEIWAAIATIDAKIANKTT